MVQSKTELINKERSGEVFKFIFTNESYNGYTIQYNFITGHLRLVLPSTDVFYTVQMKSFMNHLKLLESIKKNATLMLLIDIFLIEVNTLGNESKEFIETEEKLNLKTLSESKIFN